MFLVLWLSLEMKLTTPFQVLDKGICISLCTTTFRKDMNPSLHPQAMDKQ